MWPHEPIRSNCTSVRTYQLVVKQIDKQKNEITLFTSNVYSHFESCFFSLFIFDKCSSGSFVRVFLITIKCGFNWKWNQKSQLKNYCWNAQVHYTCHNCFHLNISSFVHIVDCFGHLIIHVMILLNCECRLIQSAGSFFNLFALHMFEFLFSVKMK